MSNSTTSKALGLPSSRKKAAIVSYSFTAIIALLFILVVATFDGVAYQLTVFFLGLAFLGIALYRNISNEVDTDELPHDTIKQKVHSFFPHLTIEKVKHWKDQNGSTSILLQVTGKDVTNDHIKSKVIRKFIKNHFNADYVVIELL